MELNFTQLLGQSQLLSTLLAASMTISVVGNLAPTVFADTIEDSEEIVVTDEASAEDENEENSEEITEETEATEETEPGNVEETDVQEEAEQTEADQETAEETAESEAAETEEAEEISESESVEETVESSEVIEETAESSAIENDEIIEEAPAATETEVVEEITETPAPTETEQVVAPEAPVAETEKEKEAELQLFHEETTVNGILVTVKADRGVFPAGSYISVTPVNDATAEALVDESRDENVNVAYSMTFDITVYNAEGIEIEPDNSKGNVYVSFKDTRVADNNLDVDVYHITDNKAVELTSEVDEDTVVAVTDSFSFYTVEFTYDSLQYVLEGDSTVALSVILDTVGLEGDVSDVSVSDESLFYAYNESGVWYVRANRAFNTDEWMKVTIAGTEYVIDVTDDVTATQSEHNNYIGYWVGPGTASCGIGGFDVYGLDNGTHIQTTYHEAGYGTRMLVGDQTVDFNNFAYGKEYEANGVKAYITAQLSDPQGKAVLITYTLTNTTSRDIRGVKIGSYADCQIANNDSAPIKMNGNGLQMKQSESGYAFYLLPGGGAFTTIWYGGYASADDNVFVNTSSINEYTGDSGLAWSWTINIPAESTVTRTAILSAGSGLTQYNVTFNANGGSGDDMGSIPYVNGVSSSLPECTYKKEGYSFMGWAESATGSVVYADQGQITVNGPKTLYAVWLKAATVETQPLAPVPPEGCDNLVYNGTAQALLSTTGSCQNGVMWFSTDKEHWSTEIPTKTAADTYTVYYKAHGDGVTYGDSAIGEINVTIDPAPAPEITDLNRPTALNQYYTGSALPLVEAPAEVPTGYTVKYRYSGMIQWVTAIPTQTDPGTYQIEYKYFDENRNHTVNEIAGGTLTAKITKEPAPSTLRDEQLPTARNLVYNGENQNLVNAPEESVNGFDKIEYKLENGSWSTQIPTGKNVGDYKVYVRYTDTRNLHETNVITRGPVNVTIAPADGPADRDALNENQLPTGKDDLIYNGGRQALVDAPATENWPAGYILEYSTDGGSTWTTEVPERINVGEYEIAARYRNTDGNYVPEVIDLGTITSKISPKQAPDGLEDNQIPTPKDNLVYNGDPQCLVNETAPENWPEGYVLEYSTDGGRTWTTTPPERINSGDYNILIRYENTDGNYTPSIIELDPIVGTIAPHPGPQEFTEEQVPTPEEDLVYTGEPIQLFEEPTDIPEGYEIEYSPDGGETWTNIPPTGEGAGDYEILVRYRNTDGNYDPEIIDGEPINVTIAPKPGPQEITEDQLPTGKEDMEYTGEPIQLVNEPENKPEGYELEYSTDGGETWTTTPPTGTDAGDYEILVRYRDPDSNYTPDTIELDPIYVTIDPMPAFDPETLTDDQKPTGNDGQEYTGDPIVLITDPIEKPEGYDNVEYSTDGGRTWTTTPPMGTDAGEYEILVRYRDPDNNHVPNIVPGETITVTIKPAHAPELETLTGKQTPKGAENQPYLGKEVELIEKARELPTNYDEVRYSIDGGKTWTNGIPTTDAAGIYVIKVKYVDTTGNHEDLMGEDIVVNILIPKDPTRFGYDFEGWFSDEEHTTPYDFAALEGNETAPAFAHWEEVNYTLIEGIDLKVNAGTDESATFRAVRNRNEQTTYSHYTYVTVDEVKLNEDEYAKRSGSIIIELDPEYIAKLAPGEHTLEIFFDDSYSVKTTFMVYAPAELPSTGETVNYIAIAAACMFFAMSATCIIVVVATKKKEEQQ